jgi:hypothetical protein
MGVCKYAKCKSNTIYPDGKGWCKKHFYVNYKAPRFYLSIFLTLILESVLSQIGYVDELSLNAIVTLLFFNVTGFTPFLLLHIILVIIIPILSFILISKYLYYWFKIE